jgi:two-component system, LuxR family, sensor kinase FixL
MSAAQPPSEMPRGLKQTATSGAAPPSARLQVDAAQRPRVDDPYTSDEVLQLLLDSVVDHAIFMLDADGRIVSWNPGAQRIEGYSAEEVLGRHVSTLYTEEDVQRDKPARDLEFAAREGRYEHKAWRVRKDGTRFWANLVLAAVRDRDGRLRGFANVTRDIAEVTRADQAAMDAGAQMLAITNAVIDGIVVIDELGKIESLNPAALRIFGYGGAAELVGRNIRMLMPEPYHGEHDSYLANYRASGVRKIIGIGREVMGKRSDGSVFPMELSVTEVHLGERRVFTGLVRDITERKKAEQELARRAEELERSNADLEQFASVASHDLQEPLRMVTAYVDLLDRKWGSRLDEEGSAFLAVIIDGATRMQSLIRDLLNYSRVGASVETSELVATRDVVAQAIDLLGHAVRETHAQIVVGELPIVIGRRNLLVQLFQNLIGNAIKFRSTSEPHISIEASALQRGWHFKVRDNGIGIDPQHSERVFDIFQRLHTKNAYPGTGIGLAICKKIVERHGGRIWVESARGAGACFQFTLSAGNSL